MWTAMVWNTNWNQDTQAAKDAFIQDVLQRYSVDVALLNEARISLLTKWQKAHPGAVLFNAGGTVGKDYTRKVYSAAVYSKHGPVEIRDAMAKSLRGRRPKIDFAQANSRPGSWIAATVPSGRGPVSCISLYGFCDELGDASMHRSLSEVSPIFSDPDYCERVLLGGDFNTFTGHAFPAHAERDRITLERIEAYGLVDCLAERAKGPLKGCPCQKLSERPCRHTLTRLIPGDDTPYQEDYLFASQALAGTLDDCFALEPEEWRSFSDHAPIIGTFKL
jgi:Endonuclease/Exonuclease/phosphatase family